MAFISANCNTYTALFNLALFYHTLGNLHPKLHSSLKTIQLIAVVKSRNLAEYGFEKVLKTFIINPNKLADVSQLCTVIIMIKVCDIFIQTGCKYEHSWSTCTCDREQ